MAVAINRDVSDEAPTVFVSALVGSAGARSCAPVCAVLRRRAGAQVTSPVVPRIAVYVVYDQSRPRLDDVVNEIEDAALAIGPFHAGGPLHAPAVVGVPAMLRGPLVILIIDKDFEAESGWNALHAAIRALEPR